MLQNTNLDGQSIQVFVPHFGGWTTQLSELKETSSKTSWLRKDKGIFSHGNGDSKSLSHGNIPATREKLKKKKKKNNITARHRHKGDKIILIIYLAGF